MQAPFLEQRYCGPGFVEQSATDDLWHFEPKDGKEQSMFLSG
jgi:hypothetical protein